MRVKISVQTPSSDQRENILLSVPKHLKYIIDLQVHIVKKLNLGEKQNQSIYLSVDGYHLPTNEKISELIKEDDLINVGFLGSKRKNKNFLGSSNIDDEEVGEYNEAERDHQFMRLIQEVSILRNLYSKTKKIKMEDIESEEGIVNVREEIVIPKTEHEIVRKNKEAKKAESSIKKQEPVVTVKKAVVKKTSIESSESESESESEDEKPRVDVKPKKLQVENKPKAQKIEPAKKKEEVSAKPKTQPVKSRPAAQAAAKKMEEEDESSSEEEEEPQIKEKKITTQLNLPNPTEVFLKKKEEWDKLPISQWGVVQREKIEKKAQAKAAAKKEAQQRPAVTQAPKEETKKNVTTPTPAVSQTTTSQFTKPVSFVPPGQAKNQPSQQIVIVSKEQTIKVKPPLHQQPKPANNANSTHNAGYSYNQYNNRQERSYNNTYNNTYNKNEEWPPVKIPVYEPNLLESVPAEDTGKTSDVSKTFPDYMEVPVSAINEKWIKDNLMLLHVNDVVKYKCETLSVKTMAPVVSDWRSGTITAIQKNRITIKRSDYVPKEKEDGEDEDEEEESEEDELFLHNLKAVCVLKTCLQEDRLKLVKGFMEYEKQKAVTKDDVAEKKRKLQEELEKKMQESEENAIKDARDYKKKMIGKQINYYFSDKNFAKDQFIKAHTEKDPDRYMPISLLLNFPKIRGMSQDLSMILESIKLVLSTESNCTYEIDPTETKIRKRVA